MRRIMTKPGSLYASAALAVLALGTVTAHDEPGARPHHIDVPANPTAVMRAFSEGKLGDTSGVEPLAAMAATPCVGGLAGGTYPCDGIDLEAFLPLAEIGSTQSNDEANDIWGWTDATSGREFAIIGRVFGTSFVEVSDPANPVFVGELDTHGRFGSPWRDVKVHADHAFIVSEARRHGMQVFDLRRLLDVDTPPVLFGETAHYRGFGSAHNIVINEDSGYAYGVGADQCAGGLAMVDISDPTNPQDAGCYAGDGYTHDAQCVIYTGPDADHQGKEICLASNEDTLTIVDVTDKTNPVQLSREVYPGVEYTHQGWLTEDQSHFLLDDELDEQANGGMTKTYVWDVSDLDAPVWISTIAGTTTAIDHNQYVRGNCSFQANYRAGLRVLEFDPELTTFSESGYFDIWPADDAAEFNAAWSSYPYFDSGTVIVSGIEQGLYVLRPGDALLESCGIGGSSGDAPPSVTIDAPAPEATVTGPAVEIVASASDAEDDDNGLAVTWQIDGGASQPMTAVGTDGDYTASWDSTGVADGEHTLTVGVTDSAGNTAATSRSVTTDNGVAVQTMHLQALAGSAEPAGRGGKWRATVTAKVHDGNEVAVDGATVTGYWSGGASGTGECLTDASGICSVSRENLNRNAATVTFTVEDLDHTSFDYAPGDNDAETSVTVNRP